METVQSIDMITIDPAVRNGRPCISGTTIEVAAVATAKVIGGHEAEEIAADYGLSLSQVYAALAYYYNRKTTIDASIQQRRQLALSMKETRVGSRHQPPFLRQ
jgi:uncharacterized protein (DUF433 family)